MGGIDTLALDLAAEHLAGRSDHLELVPRLLDQKIELGLGRSPS